MAYTYGLLSMNCELLWGIVGLSRVPGPLSEWLGVLKARQATSTQSFGRISNVDPPKGSIIYLHHRGLRIQNRDAGPTQYVPATIPNENGSTLGFYNLYTIEVLEYRIGRFYVLDPPRILGYMPEANATKVAIAWNVRCISKPPSSLYTQP